MTNQEAIKIGEDIIVNMRNHSWSEFENQDFEAIQQLIQTAKAYDALIASGKHYTYDDILNMSMREK